MTFDNPCYLEDVVATASDPDRGIIAIRKRPAAITSELGYEGYMDNIVQDIQSQGKPVDIVPGTPEVLASLRERIHRLKDADPLYVSGESPCCKPGNDYVCRFRYNPPKPSSGAVIRKK